VRYLGGLDERMAHVVELHPYTTLDELSSLAHKVELQKKVKGNNKPPKPLKLSSSKANLLSSKAH